MGEKIVYFGTYSAEETKVGASRGIYCYRLDEHSGALRFHGSEDDRFNPSYLALSPDGRFLYAADELADRAVISAYQIDQATRQLSFINRQTLPGRCTAHVSIAPDGRTLFAANYMSGSVLSVRVEENGALGELITSVLHQGSSVDPERQTKPYAHCAMPDRAGKHLVVCDLGADILFSYDIHPDGELTLNGICAVPPGEGPRHLIFDRNGDRAFVLTEMGSHVIRYEYDQVEGRLIQRQMLTALPEGVERADSNGADIQLSPDERHLYASNRDISGAGRDTIARYRFEGEQLVPDGFIETGAIPRGFALSPDGRLLLACCQQGNCVQVFEALSGRLLHEEVIPAPVCAKFAVQ